MGISKLTILFSGNSNALNGAAIFVRLLGDEEFWKKNGIELSVESNNQSYKDEKEYRKTPLFYLKSKAKQLLNLTRVGKYFFAKYEFFILGKTIVNRIKPNNQTCYLLNDYMVAHLFYQKYGTNYRTVFIMHNNGNMLSMVDEKLLSNKRTGVFFRQVEKEIIEYADDIIFVSDTAMNSFVDIHTDKAYKCSVINIGLEDEEYVVSSTDDTIRFVSVGTLEERKNQISIIRVIESCISKNPDIDINLTLIGGGPLMGDWRRYVVERKLSNHVRFVGPQTNVDQYLMHSDVFIMSSKDEGLPVAAQEAMRAGLALILTDVGGCRELIDGNGYLVKTPNDAEILQAVEKMIINKDQINSMKSRSKELFSQKYTREKMLLRYLELIHSSKKGIEYGEACN